MITPLDIAEIGELRASYEWEDDHELAEFMTYPDLVADCVQGTFWRAVLEGEILANLDKLQESLKLALEIPYLEKV